MVGTLLFAGLLIRQLRLPEPNRFLWAGALILGAFTIGTNEISLVQLLGIATGALLVCRRHSKHPYVALWILLAGLLACAAVEVFAPGNFHRAGRYGGAGTIPTALWQSLAVSVYLWLGWLADSLLLPAGLLWVLLLAAKRRTLEDVATAHRWTLRPANREITMSRFFHFQPRTAVENGGPSFNFGSPIYWLAGLLLITPVSLFPLLYATGGQSLPERVVDLTFFLVAILWFGTIAALFAAYGQRLPAKAGVYLPLAVPLSVFLALHLFADGLDIDRETPRARAAFFDLIKVDANIGRGWLGLLDGTASRYAREMEEIGREVERCETAVCLVAPLTAGGFIGYDPMYDGWGGAGMPGWGGHWATPGSSGSATGGGNEPWPRRLSAAGGVTPFPAHWDTGRNGTHEVR